MSHLARLRHEMDEAERKYFDAIRRYEAAVIADHPMKPGDVIKSTKGELAQVVSVSVRAGFPQVYAVQRKKDGTFGRRPVQMWREEWRKPEVVVPLK